MAARKIYHFCTFKIWKFKERMLEQERDRNRGIRRPVNAVITAKIMPNFRLVSWLAYRDFQIDKIEKKIAQSKRNTLYFNLDKHTVVLQFRKQMKILPLIIWCDCVGFIINFSVRCAILAQHNTKVIPFNLHNYTTNWRKKNA